jgi:flavin-binding monooxygenase-like protein
VTRRRVCVIGGGTAGLAVCKALLDGGITFDCFERGTEVGGNWRYDNDSGTSACYASLRTNISRTRMQYRALPMPSSWGDYVHHTHMADYLSTFADTFGLRAHIHFRTDVSAAHPAAGGGWKITTASADNPAHTETGHFSELVVASGHDWSPTWPAFPGTFSGNVLHAHDYRAPDQFAGCRVLVVGAGNSASEIAAEVSTVAARTLLAVRHSAHVVPRYVFGRPADQFDTPMSLRLPWRLVRSVFEVILRLARGRLVDYGLPEPAHGLLMAPPAVTSELLPALRRGAITVKPNVERLNGDRVRFCDGSEEPLDAIIYATGYGIRFPFLDESRLFIGRKSIPLYRRIVPPEVSDLYFVGMLDPGGGLPPLVELQARWLAKVLAGRIRLPDQKRMYAAIEAAEPRSRDRFSAAGPYTILCDQWAYRALLQADLRHMS